MLLRMTNLHRTRIDPVIQRIITNEDNRQKHNLELIASENFTSSAVRLAMSSRLTNKYSEGQIGKRYYGGTENIDELEAECKSRALDLFRLDPKQWTVNVQPLSGSPANFAVFCGLLKPQDRILGLSLTSGGHLSHAAMLNGRKLSASALFFEGDHYEVNPKTGLIDYSEVEKKADLFKPNMVIVGGSAYTRDYDYSRMRAIADKNNSYLLADMSHISGLVAAQEANNPFDHCDIVTTTTHKTLRGPRSAMIFSKIELKDQIDFGVFPLLQGGPHNHQIAAVAVALNEAKQPDFRDYIKEVKYNAVVLSETLQQMGYEVVTGGTDNHIVLINVKNSKGITGSKAEKILEYANISTNKNTVPGDTSALNPSGIRLGTPAMTTRGVDAAGFRKVASFIDRALSIGVEIQETTGKLLKDFEAALPYNEKLRELKQEVSNFCENFELP